MLTGQSIESVGQAVGVKSEKKCRQITFSVDTAACRTVVLARHPATRGTCVIGTRKLEYRTRQMARLLWEMKLDICCKPMTIESRQAEVRRPLMAVKPMTQQEQWVVHSGLIVHSNTRLALGLKEPHT